MWSQCRWENRIVASRGLKAYGLPQGAKPRAAVEHQPLSLVNHLHAGGVATGFCCTARR